MITKIISGLLGISVAFSSTIALADLPKFIGRTDDGTKVYLESDITELQDGSVRFHIYTVGRIGRSKQITFVTPWCASGGIAKGASYAPDIPGYYFEVDNHLGYFDITEDSVTTKLLTAVCEVTRGQDD